MLCGWRSELYNLAACSRFIESKRAAEEVAALRQRDNRCCSIQDARFHGLNFEPVNFVTFVNALVNDVHKPGAEQEQPPNFWSWLASLVGLQGDQQ